MHSSHADSPQLHAAAAGGEHGVAFVAYWSTARLLLQRWGWVLAMFVASRLIIAFLTRLSRMIFAPGEYWQRNGITGMLTQGDSERYLHIAAAGYGTGAEAAANVGSFPLYPALIRVFSIIFEPAMAAMVISNIALLAAGILLKELVDLHYKEPRISRAAVTFLMFAPVSFFFSGAYPEATLLAFTLGAFLAAAKGRWLAAALCGAAASLTSSIGVLVFVPLAIEAFRRRDADDRSQSPRAAQLASLALIPLACAAFLLFSYLRFGDAFAPIRASHVWAGGLAAPWTSIGAIELLPKFYRNFSGLMLSIGGALLILGIVLRVRASQLVFAALLLAVYTCTADVASIARELSIVFPFFIILAVASRRFQWSYEPMLACAFTVFSFCTIMAANGHWMR
jgi:hypothetical protein